MHTWWQLKSCSAVKAIIPHRNPSGGPFCSFFPSPWTRAVGVIRKQKHWAGTATGQGVEHSLGSRCLWWQLPQGRCGDHREVPAGISAWQWLEVLRQSHLCSLGCVWGQACSQWSLKPPKLFSIWVQELRSLSPRLPARHQGKGRTYRAWEDGKQKKPQMELGCHGQGS